MNADGHEVAPGLTIHDDASSVSINAAGEVYAYFSDQVQPQLQPGQDPSQLVTDVTDTEDGHRRPGRQRLEQQPDHALVRPIVLGHQDAHSRHAGVVDG